jgi:general secretion pathway protein G
LLFGFAMHSRITFSRRRRRGVTLVEMLIVVSIMAIVAGGVAVAAMKYWNRAREQTAKTNARGIRHAVKGWWLTQGDMRCPNVAELLSAGVLDDDSPPQDPWGNPWHIECDSERVTVSSDGPDRQNGTADDIRVPPKRT